MLYCCFVINFVLCLIIRIRIGLCMKRMIIKVLIYMNYKIVVSRICINDIDGDFDFYILDLIEILENVSLYFELFKKIIIFIFSNIVIKI